METDYARLEECIDQRNWDSISNFAKPKYFPRSETGKLASPLVIARIADAVTNTSICAPEKAKIVLLKCLLNSCVNGYIPQEYETREATWSSNDNFYALLCENYVKLSKVGSKDEHGYPVSTHFPYGGVARWAADYVAGFSLDGQDLRNDEPELLRLSLQFLCNLGKSCLQSVRKHRFKEVTKRLLRYEYLPVLRAACAFIHNALTLFGADYFTELAKNEFTILLIKPVKLEIPAAIDALKYLLKNTGSLKDVYEEVAIDDRLYLLEILHQELRESGSSGDTENDFSTEVVPFLAHCFKRKSDLVLKTVNTYLDGTEPMEIMILLDILGVLTSTTLNDKNYINNLQDDKSLLINCIYLLKSLHMVGKESDNFFTPVQRLNELAPSGHNSKTDDNEDSVTNAEKELECSNRLPKADDIQSHPAFGFKAGLIRVIGNMVHKHKGNQDLLRETDGIPLLLDCCNMDARNPLIMQWTILAMRNVCESNAANQDVVRGLNKVGVADSSVLREMGITLHDDGVGKAVGIAPLRRD